jgi:hypothetical protein
MRFDEFDLPIETPDCSQDFVEINHVRYCGNQLRGAYKIIPFSFNSSPGEIVIRFSSDRFTSGKGFHATYSQIPCSKNSLSHAASSIVSSSSSSGSMPAGTVNPSSSSSVVVASATAQSSIRHDLPGISGSSLPDLPPVHPMHNPEPSMTSGDRISVMTGSSSNHKEQMSTFPRVPCDLVIYDMYFEISSPGYPYSYPNFADCLFSIRRINDRICSIVISFNELDLHPLDSSDDHCTAGDFLQIGSSHRFCQGIRNGTKSE